jgi:hypothetical protein
MEEAGADRQLPFPIPVRKGVPDGWVNNGMYESGHEVCDDGGMWSNTSTELRYYADLEIELKSYQAVTNHRFSDISCWSAESTKLHTVTTTVSEQSSPAGSEQFEETMSEFPGCQQGLDAKDQSLYDSERNKYPENLLSSEWYNARSARMNDFYFPQGPGEAHGIDATSSLDMSQRPLAVAQTMYFEPTHTTTGLSLDPIPQSAYSSDEKETPAHRPLDSASAPGPTQPSPTAWRRLTPLRSRSTPRLSSLLPDLSDDTNITCDFDATSDSDAGSGFGSDAEPGHPGPSLLPAGSATLTPGLQAPFPFGAPWPGRGPRPLKRTPYRPPPLPLASLPSQPASVSDGVRVARDAVGSTQPRDSVSPDAAAAEAAAAAAALRLSPTAPPPGFPVRVRQRHPTDFRPAPASPTGADGPGPAPPPPPDPALEALVEEALLRYRTQFAAAAGDGEEDISGSLELVHCRASAEESGAPPIPPPPAAIALFLSPFSLSISISHSHSLSLTLSLSLSLFLSLSPNLGRFRLVVVVGRPPMCLPRPPLSFSRPSHPPHPSFSPSIMLTHHGICVARAKRAFGAEGGRGRDTLTHIHGAG